MRASIKKKGSVQVVRLRITVVEPPSNILWALQLGRAELVEPSAVSKARIGFDFSIEIIAGDSPRTFRLKGPAAQGRPGEQFVYLRIGAYAGQVGAPAGWRAKVSLEGITCELLDNLREKHAEVLEAQFAGTARDGGPSRASVALLGADWSVA